MSSRWTWTTIYSLSALAFLALPGCRHLYFWQDTACDECCQSGTCSTQYYDSIQMPIESMPTPAEPELAPLPAPAPSSANPYYQRLSTSQSMVTEPVESKQSLVPNRPRMLTRINESIQSVNPFSSKAEQPAVKPIATPAATAQPVVLEQPAETKTAPVINVSITMLPPQYNASQQTTKQYQTVSTNGYRHETYNAGSSRSVPTRTLAESGVEMWPHRPAQTAQAPHQFVVGEADHTPAAEPAAFTIVPRTVDTVDEEQTAPALNPFAE